jgi:putative membrane protein
LTFAAALALVAAPALANAPGGGGSAMAGKPAAMVDDATFMKQAAMGGLAEVSHGKLAAARGGTAAVKSFAQMMVKDHTKANGELMALAKQKGVALPTTMDPAHQKMEAQLSTLKGAAFDKAYVAGQVKDHEKTVALFEGEAAHGKIPEAKAWAAKTLPTLKMHLDHARKMVAGGHGEGHM